MRQYGLKLDKIEPEHYVFGSSLPFEEIQSDGDWTNYLPLKELQNLGLFEPYACVTFTVLNCIETLIKKKYGMDVNFSDRFLASISGTKEGGNSPQVVCEYLRKEGVVPQDLWPYDETIDTFDKFYEEIPQDIKDMAKEFNKEWDFQHEFVPGTHEMIGLALKCSPLLVSVPAWFERDGKYYRPEGAVDSHATTLFYQKEGEFMRIFDTYDYPNIKDLEWNMIPMQMKRFAISRIDNTKKRNNYWFEDLFINLGVFIKDICTNYCKKP